MVHFTLLLFYSFYKDRVQTLILVLWLENVLGQKKYFWENLSDTNQNIP